MEKITTPTFQPNGAGVLLFEQYFCMKTKKSGLAVTLFGSVRRSGFVFSDCGGSLSDNEDTAKCAQRELLEETANLVNLPTKVLTTWVKVKKYICYLVFVEQPDKELRQVNFRKNSITLSDEHAPHCWRETKAMRRVFIDELKLLLKANDERYKGTIMSACGEQVNLQPRVIGVLQEVFRRGLLDLEGQTIKAPAAVLTRLMSQKASRMLYLQNTLQLGLNQLIGDIKASEEYQVKLRMGEQSEVNYTVMEIPVKNCEDERLGAGAMVFCVDTNNRLGFLLAKSLKRGICSDMGGGKNKTDKFESETAGRELREESANTLAMDGVTAGLLAVKLCNYMCFLLRVDRSAEEIQTTFQKNNILIASKEATPKCWRGKEKLVFFEIEENRQNILKTGEEKMELINGEGVVETIRNRTANLLRGILQHNWLEKTLLSTMKVEVNKDNSEINKEFEFLKDTKSFILVSN